MSRKWPAKPWSVQAAWDRRIGRADVRS